MSSCKFENVCRCAIHSLLVWTVLVSFCSGYVNWIYPNVEMSGLTFNYMDTVDFAWTSNIPDPYINLWCAPSNTGVQSQTPAYHNQTSTNGTSPQSFKYSQYYNNGICHMQIEDYSADDNASTPTFTITSNDAVMPQTWGLSALGGASNPTAMAPSSSTEISSTFIATAVFSSSPSWPASWSSSSLTEASPTIPPTTITITAAAPTASSSSPSSTLNAAAKAGISIGSIFCALALITTVLLCRKAWSSRTRGKRQDLNGFGPDRRYNSQNAETGEGARAETGEGARAETGEAARAETGEGACAETGEGAYYEMTGVAIPKELYEMPRQELEGAPPIELSSASER